MMENISVVILRCQWLQDDNNTFGLMDKKGQALKF